MNKSEYEELKYLINEYDNADEGNDALVKLCSAMRRWCQKYEEKTMKN